MQCDQPDDGPGHGSEDGPYDGPDDVSDYGLDNAMVLIMLPMTRLTLERWLCWSAE